MSKRIVRPTPPQLRRLLADVRAQPPSPLDSHLSTENFVGYALAQLAAAETTRVDSHLAVCRACAARMEQFLAQSEVWRGKQAQPRLVALRTRLATMPARPPTLLEEVQTFFNAFIYSLAPLSPLAARADTTAAEPQEFASHDGRLSLFIVEREDGDLVVHFDAHAPDLAGRVIALAVGDWQRQASLVTVPGEAYVAAELYLSHQERAALPAGIALQVRLVDESELAENDSNQNMEPRA